MAGSFAERQAQINAVLKPMPETPADESLPAIAERGMRSPQSLSLGDIKKMCFVASIQLALQIKK